ncbi:hypothetical protein LSAT2_010148 [Lamellibrachia satsuma]|nr:hypothetical protein LSAT2_010148 [Lamellibrachia satsuma]
MLCVCYFSVASGGRTDMRRHVEIARHQEMSKTMVLTKGGMDQYVANDNNAIDVTKAETMLAYNNLPMSAADEFSRMIPAVFPDRVFPDNSLGSPLASSPPAPQTLYHAPPSQATYAQRSPFPSPPAPWTLYHAQPSPSNVHQTPPDDATSWQTRMFYILEKQNSEMAEMKRMLSSLMKKVATSREDSVPTGI